MGVTVKLSVGSCQPGFLGDVGSGITKVPLLVEWYFNYGQFGEQETNFLE